MAAGGYRPSDEETEALEVLNRRFKADDKSRLDLEAQWTLNAAFVKGLQYLQFDTVQRQLVFAQAPSLRWRARSVHNLCRPAVRQAVATIGNFRPRFKVRPATADPEDMQASAVGEGVLSHYWDLNRMPRKKWELAQQLKTYGNSFLYVCWNPSGGDPMHSTRTVETPDGPVEAIDVEYEGEIETRVRSPFNIYWDPLAASIEDIWWLMDVGIEPIEWIEQHFPEKAAIVTPGIADSAQTRHRWQVGSTSSGTSTSESSNEWAVVKRLWEKPTYDYPRGRLIIAANDVILAAGDNPTPRGMLPFVWFQDELVTDQVAGQCDMDNLVTLQRSYNRLQSKELEHVILTANAKLLEHSTNQLPDASFTSEIGEKMTWHGQTPPEWLPPPPLPNDLQDLKASILADIDRTTSTHGPERGQQTGRTSGRAYLTLIEQGLANKAPVVERFADGLAQWGKLVLEWAQAYVDEDRLIKVTGRGKQLDIEAFRGADLKGNTDVTIDVDSVQPKSKAMALEIIQGVAPGQPLMNFQDPGDRARAWRMLGQEDDSQLLADKQSAEREAEIENKYLLLGQTAFPGGLPIRPDWSDDQDVHVELHLRAKRSDEYKLAEPIIRALLDAHIAGHLNIARPQVGVTVTPEQEESGMGGPGDEDGGQDPEDSGGSKSTAKKKQDTQKSSGRKSPQPFT